MEMQSSGEILEYLHEQKWLNQIILLSERFYYIVTNPIKNVQIYSLLKR